MPSPADVIPAPPPHSGTLESAGEAQSTHAFVREQFEQFKAEFLAAVKAERRSELHVERRRLLARIAEIERELQKPGERGRSFKLKAK